MGNTSIYDLFFIEPYMSNYPLDADERRFNTLESLAYNLYAIFGNGIIDDDPDNPSWRIQVNPADSSGGSVLVTPGHGHLYYAAAKTTTSQIVKLPIPIGAGTVTEYWLYATPNDTTPDQMTCTFVASLTEIVAPETYIGLGAVTVDTSTTPPTVTCYNDSDHGRVNISLFATLAAIINAHVHIGGANNPSPINLALHVQGKLSSDYIADLDASAIDSGVVPADRLPQIDHNSLADRGTLTHPEIEGLIAPLIAPSGYYLSDLEIANQLIMALAIMHQTAFNAPAAPDVPLDHKLINTFLYVPGITATKYEDTTSGLSLATIDRVNHKIIGTSATGINANTLVFNTQAQFNGAYQLTNIAVTDDSGGSFTLARPLNYRGVASADLSAWQTGMAVTDNPTKSPSTAPKTDLLDNFTARRYLFCQFSALGGNYAAPTEDWSDVQRIGIGFGLTPDSHPGNVYAFLILGSGGTQTGLNLSNNGGPTQINISEPVEIYDHTAAQSTTAYVQLNLSEFVTDASQLADVRGIGFFWQTTSTDVNSWDARSLDFSVAVPSPTQIQAAAGDSRVNNQRAVQPDLASSIFVWNETLYAPTGQLVLRLTSSSSSTYWNLVNYSSSTVPSGASMNVQTRVANDLTTLGSAQLYAVDPSTYFIASASHQGQYLDVVVNLYADTTYTESPEVFSLIVSLSAAALPANHVWGALADWQSGITPFLNIDMGDPGIGVNYLTLADTTQVGAYLFLRGNEVRTATQITNDPTTLYVDATHLYLTPLQLWNHGIASGLSSPQDFSRLDSGNLLIVDTGNDRVMEVDQTGALVRAIQGNLRLKTASADFVALGAYYNPRLGYLWIAFSQNVTVGSKTLITLSDRSGANQIGGGTTGVNVVLDNPLNGLSPTIKITLSADLMARVNSWSSGLQVILSDGSVKTAGPSSDGTVTPSSSATTTTSSGTTTTTTDPGIAQIASFAVNVGTGALAGAFASKAGLPIPATEAQVQGDYNADGQVTTTLQGPGGQSVNVTLVAVSGEIVFDNLYNPVSAQPGSLSQWIVASTGSACVRAYDSLSNMLWSIPTSVAFILDSGGGAAWQMANGNVAIACPIPNSTATQGALVIVNQAQNNTVVANIPINGSGVRVIATDDSQQYWILVDDVLHGGQNSRLDRVDIAGNVQWTWGSGQLAHPTGLRLLPNGDVLISQ